MAAVQRLKRELKKLLKEPIPFVEARPKEDNMLEWHFIVTGPPDTPYDGGQYHGIVRFPPQYPFKPPSFMMVTPSGRFQPNKRICLSMSDFHPETWNPLWSIGTMLSGLLSFMIEESPSVGTVKASTAERRALSVSSYAFNKGNSQFRAIFPDKV